MTTRDNNLLADVFSIPARRVTQPRPRRAACWDCDRVRQLETVTVGDGIEADLCRQCRRRYQK